MEFYKLAGILLLAVSGTLGAHLLNRRATEALSRAEGWLALIRSVKTQVECFALPATDLLRGVDGDLLAKCGYQGAAAPKSFRQLLEGSSIEDAETRRLVTGFCKEFGTGYRAEQVQSCGYYAAGLEARRQTLASALPNRKKLNATLCLSGALALMILLI